MNRRGLTVSILTFGLVVLTGCAGRESASGAMAPPGGEYQKVSLLFPPFPDYLPGQGILYVKAKTLPLGPFLAYDKQGHLVATMYMVPIRDVEAHRKFENLGAAPDMKPQRVQLYYHDGHPGVAEPHYHVILWYIPENQEPK